MNRFRRGIIAAALALTGVGAAAGPASAADFVLDATWFTAYSCHTHTITSTTIYYSCSGGVYHKPDGWLMFGGTNCPTYHVKTREWTVFNAGCNKAIG